MATGTGVKATVIRTLKRLNATAKSVSLRTVSYSGGSARLGIGQTKTVTDTACDPQPYVERVSARDVATGGGLYQPGDYRFIFAGSTSESALRTSLIVYGMEVLQPIQTDAMVLDGVVVAWEVIARTLSAGD